jgi:hypothetical protein
LVGNINASLQEIGYSRKFDKNKDGLSLIFIYGQSNLPTY